MSLPTDPELLEQQLALDKREAKYRFIGACTLLVVALCTLPFVLNAPPRPAPTLKVEITKPVNETSKPSSTANPATTPALTATPSSVAAPVSPLATADKPTPEPAATSAQSTVKPTKQAPLVFQKEVSKDDARAKALLEGQEPSAERTGATESKGKYAVQVGSFADATKAQAVLDKLASAGVEHQATQTTNKKGEARTRIRVIGFATERDAQSAAAKLKAIGLETSIIKP